MNCVLHFENWEQVADAFAEKHLGPRLAERGQFQQTEIQWVPYSNSNDWQGPAQDAARRIATNAWDKVVFVVDMDATGKETPVVRFGLDMLQHLAQLAYCNQQVPLASLLSDRKRLTCTLSIFTPQFDSTVQNLWAPVVNQIAFVQPNKDERNIDRDTDRALTQIRADGLRIVVADRIRRGEWLATLIAKWLS